MQRYDRAECENCEIPFTVFGEETGCPECGKRKYMKIGEEVQFRGKFLHIDEECVEDYIETAEEHLRELEELKKEGFECGWKNSPGDDYHTLYREYE